VPILGGSMSGYGAPNAGDPAGYGQPPYQAGPPPAYQQPGYQQPGYQQPGYQQPGYQQPGYPPAPPPPRRRSRLPLVLGIGAAVVVLLIIANVIVFKVVLNHNGQTSDTTALYHKVGKPAGFHQKGDPTMTGHTELQVTLTATKTGGYDPVQATTTWLDSFGGSNPPSKSDVAYDFAHHQLVSPNGFEPHSVSAQLDTDGGNAYTIELDIIY
jgi:hypothetical protein